MSKHMTNFDWQIWLQLSVTLFDGWLTSLHRAVILNITVQYLCIHSWCIGIRTITATATINITYKLLTLP